MRNLKLIKQLNVRHDKLQSATLFCVDPDKKTVYFLACDLNIWKMESRCDGNPVVELHGCLMNSEPYFESVVNHFVSFDFLVVEQCLYLAGSKGDVVRHTYNDETEFVEFIEGGITALSWSPDQELAVVVSGNNQLLLMTSEFSLLQTTAIDSDQFGESQPVTVGWGKKETQFHGSAGKAAAREQIQAVEPASEYDDKKIRISWREDGQFFVVSYIAAAGGNRQFRVCSREGIIQYTSEYVQGLEQALFWQPTGTLIASTIRKPNKHVVAFFEKNCLQHGEFTISSSNNRFKVCELMWNLDSTVLAIWLKDLVIDETADKDADHYIQLWTVNNYHWYFKQSLNFGLYGLKVRQVQWDLSCANQLNILCLDGSFLSYTWSWTTSCSAGPLESDNGIVAVIDGNEVKVTPFLQVTVPPPLCAYSCQAEKPVSNIIFGPQSKCNEFLIVLDDQTLLHFSDDLSNARTEQNCSKLENKSLGVQGPPNAFTGNIELNLSSVLKPVVPLALMHWTWSNPSQLLFTYTFEMKSVLCIATISWNSEEFSHSADISCIQLEGEVVQMCSSSSGNHTAIQFSDGSFVRYDHTENLVYPWYVNNNQQLTLRQSCNEIRLVSIDSKDHILAYCGTSLYFDTVELAAYCTSVCLSGDFILYTTSDHVLHCLLKQSLGQGDIKKTVTLTEKLRNVERGSRIVTTTFGSKLIFQMPRGNLETVYPRPLVLHVIRQFLDNLNYKEAMTMMRRHRIDMNLFVDHDRISFLKNVDKFVEQIDDVDLFNLFLSYLSEEDVTSTVYNIASKSNSKDIHWEGFNANKVDIICEALRNALEKCDPNKYFLSVLTCHVKMKTPQLEIALQKIKDRPLKDQDSALNYLHRLVNVDDLFNIALGTYDFQLVTMVAEKTQKDPKDYLPFLNEVQKMDSNYGKFTIDKHIKRHTRALEHIIACGDERFTECLSFIESHHLYSEALKLMSKSSPQYQILLETYGDLLVKRNSYEEAGILFMKGKVYEKALEAFKLCSNWTKAFSAAHCLNYDSESLRKLGKQLAVNLKNDRRFVEAAYVLETYTNNPEESINVLLEGHEWERAAMMIYKINATHLIESLMKPALLSHLVHLTSTLQQNSSVFERHRNRLMVVRELKKAKLNDDNFDDDSSSVDQFSETSSSRFTYSDVTGSAYTSRTARNRRKLDRKRVSLKEGSPFEDVAILEALTKILTQMDNLKDECSSLVKVLSLFDFDDEATKLQCQLETSLKCMLNYKVEIWPPEESVFKEALTLGPQTTSNILATENMRRLQKRNPPPEYLSYTYPPSLREVNWKLSYLMPSKKW